jgi:hypothetical protein
MLKHFRAFDKQAVDIRPRTSGSYSHTERLAYILKGADKATAMKHHLFGKDNRWKGSQGLIPFKRVGVRYQRQLSLGFKCFHN